MLETPATQADTGPLPIGAPMYYSAGNDVGWQPIVPPGNKALTPAQVAEKAANRATIAKREGLTSLEPYVKWWLCEPEPGRWDFSYYDTQARAAKEAGIHWLPFLIAGPAYSTPPWFKNSPESLFARCLEHDQETKTQSIWNPQLRPHVKDFLQHFAAHFDPAGIESVLLGISGDFGESIYTAGGNIWTYLNDPYHVHAGYWCGDKLARADFREKMQQRYGTIARLNAAWGTQHESFAAVEPFLPAAAPNRRARLDLQRWYCAAMTDWASFWMNATRQAMPRARILLCTGGSGAAMLGADFSAQAQAAAHSHAGIRITNEATDYTTNFMLTRHVATACRHYGAFFGFEPAGDVAPEGIIGRIYNATASGADELFTYDPEPSGERGAKYAAARHFLVKRNPAIDVGLFLNRTAADLDRQHGFFNAGRELRTVTDFDLVDEKLIADGALKPLRVFFWHSGGVTEGETTRAIESWVRAGGLLVISDVDSLETVEGDRAPQQALLGKITLPGAQRLERYRLDIGGDTEEGILRGEWHPVETNGGFADPNTTYRWSTDGSAVELPLPDAANGATIAVHLIARGPQPEALFLQVAGKEVARIPGAGEHILRFHLDPEQLAGKKTITLEFAGTTWQPSAAGAGDTRHLGVGVDWIAVGKGDLSAEALAQAPTPGHVPGVTEEKLVNTYTHRLGKGAVVFLPQGDVSLADAARLAVFHPEKFIPGAKAPYPELEGDANGVFLTRFQDGSALLLNFTDQEKVVRYAGRELKMAPRSIGEYPATR